MKWFKILPAIPIALAQCLIHLRPVAAAGNEVNYYFSQGTHKLDEFIENLKVSGFLPEVHTYSKIYDGSRTLSLKKPRDKFLKAFEAAMNEANILYQRLDPDSGASRFDGIPTTPTLLHGSEDAYDSDGGVAAQNWYSPPSTWSPRNPRIASQGRTYGNRRATDDNNNGGTNGPLQPRNRFAPPPPLRSYGMAHGNTVELVVERDDVAVTPIYESGRMESPGSQQKTDRRSRRSKWTPPTSLQDHFKKKGYLSVTELTSPSWCEYNYQYSVLGALSSLPPSQRPEKIVTPEGATLQPSLVVLEEKERVIKRGKAVHAQLEWEAQPGEAVQLKTTTKEDIWAARLLGMWCKLQWLRQGGTVREFELCGWIDGEFVRGVVDEIARRPLEKSPHDAATTNGDSATVSSEDKEKVWASQEEWKRDQRRRQTTATKSKKDQAKDAQGSKLKTTKLDGFGFGSPAKKAKLEGITEGGPDGSQFGETASPSASQGQEPVSRHEATGWGYFLSDTKTRVSPSLPSEQDQTQARTQCMIYKRLFDGMCLGALSSRPPTGVDPDSDASPIPRMDPYAIPLHWIDTLTSLCIWPHAPLSSEFLASALPLAESWNCDLLSLPSSRPPQADNESPPPEGCTLADIVTLLESGIRTFLDDARLGASLSEPKRQGAGTSKGKYGPAALQNELQLTYIHQPRTLTRPGKRSTRSKRGPPRYLGHVTFPHDPERLQRFLVDALSLWKGERALRGVALAETRRCWSCVWREGCEWRNKMAADAEAVSSRSHRRQDGSAASVAGLPDGGTDGTGQRQVREHDTVQWEDEAELWTQVSDISASDLLDF